MALMDMKLAQLTRQYKRFELKFICFFDKNLKVKACVHKNIG